MGTFLILFVIYICRVGFVGLSPTFLEDEVVSCSLCSAMGRLTAMGDVGDFAHSFDVCSAQLPICRPSPQRLDLSILGQVQEQMLHQCGC